MLLMGMEILMQYRPTTWNLSQLIENHRGEELQILIKSIEQAAKRIEVNFKNF
jgi:hypothetical protein